MIIRQKQNIFITSFKSFITGYHLFSTSCKKEGRASTSLRNQKRSLFGSLATLIHLFSCLVDEVALANGFSVCR